MVQDKKRKLKIKQREHSQKDLQAKIFAFWNEICYNTNDIRQTGFAVRK